VPQRSHRFLILKERYYFCFPRFIDADQSIDLCHCFFHSAKPTANYVLSEHEIMYGRHSHDLTFVVAECCTRATTSESPFLFPSVCQDIPAYYLLFQVAVGSNLRFADGQPGRSRLSSQVLSMVLRRVDASIDKSFLPLTTIWEYRQIADLATGILALAWSE